MGWTFSIKYKKQIYAIINSNGNSGYSNHLLSTGYTCMYGTITDTVETG